MLATAAMFNIAAVLAEPRIPQREDEILQRIPAGQASRRLAPLRSRVQAAPQDAAAALELARGYLQIGRAESDPRHVSYALTTVAPLIAAGRENVAALVLAAEAEQYLHRFDSSLLLLDRALRADPGNAQALLIRADLLEVRGDLGAARTACAALAGRADNLIVLTCLTSIASRSGQLDASYERLRSVYEGTPRLDAGVDTWILSVLAEMAQRRGDEDSRKRYLLRAVQQLPDDPKLKAQYADLLLDEDDPAAVIALLRDHEDQDTLLLRLALAATRLHGAGDADAARWRTAFAERQRMAMGDARHQREEARFLLELGLDHEGALRAATTNWERQREPEDLRLLLAAATAAGRPQAAAAAREWMSTQHYEDRTLR